MAERSSSSLVVVGPERETRRKRVTQIAEATRTFFFADLRDYTGFVERSGDRAAAELLKAYRSIVRRQVATTGGADIKTEGGRINIVITSVHKPTRSSVAT